MVGPSDAVCWRAQRSLPGAGLTAPTGRPAFRRFSHRCSSAILEKERKNVYLFRIGMKGDQASTRNCVRRHGARVSVPAFIQREATKSPRDLARTSGQEQIPGRRRKLIERRTFTEKWRRQ